MKIFRKIFTDKEETMGKFKEYGQYDGLGLAELIRKGEVSEADVYEAAMERIETLNPKINAVVTDMADEGQKALKAGLPKGPFTGVPFLLKDLLAAYKGIPLTRGCKGLKNYIPDFDSELVKRYKSAGVVILGKTNCPEFGLMGFTEPELHGPTLNPWNIHHTPGGSSGGSAAAVAAGMVPMASGGDGGGSIRIPASHCGLFGLKPTRGRVPTGPEHGEIWQGAVVEHIISRSVRDSAAMLDANQGPDTGAPFKIPRPQNHYMEEIKQAPGKLKIAFNTVSPIDTHVDPECVTAVEQAATLLAKLGHHVEEARPAINGKSLARSYMMLYFGEVAADIEDMQAILGRKANAEDVETVTWTLGLLGRSYSAGQFVQNLREWGSAARVMGEFHKKYDLYVTPTTASPPVKIGELKAKPAEILLMKTVSALRLGRLLKATGIIDQMAIDSLSKTPFTQIANFTGQPAMSVPLHWTKEGLPCGVQFIADVGNEATLFRLAAQLEGESPWFDKRSPLTF